MRNEHLEHSYRVREGLKPSLQIPSESIKGITHWALA